ncbi:hypothetical protein GXW82_43065 [Streptacidiphilus sp. 4-A2]|nr:hypothetical protein [Streptacidiphilus sp. 4-A2]
MPQRVSGPSTTPGGGRNPASRARPRSDSPLSTAHSLTKGSSQYFRAGWCVGPSWSNICAISSKAAMYCSSTKAARPRACSAPLTNARLFDAWATRAPRSTISSARPTSPRTAATSATEK